MLLEIRIAPLKYLIFELLRFVEYYVVQRSNFVYLLNKYIPWILPMKKIVAKKITEDVDKWIWAMQ